MDGPRDDDEMAVTLFHAPLSSSVVMQDQLREFQSVVLLVIVSTEGPKSHNGDSSGTLTMKLQCKLFGIIEASDLA